MQRHLRLRHRDDFARLREQGQVQRHPLVIVSVAPNSLPHNRYGFITSKQLGNAVKRNRVRRVLREAVRRVHPSVKPGYDVVVIARRRIIGQPYQAVQRAVTSCLKQAGLWEQPE